MSAKRRIGQKKGTKQKKDRKKKEPEKKNIQKTILADTSQKKQKKRATVKYPGLHKGVNGRFRQDVMDMDYIDQLSDKEKQFLSNFMEEYLSGNINHPGKKLHKTKKELKECYGRNNSRNRDLLNHQKAKGLLVNSEDYRAELEKSDTVSQEDLLIEAIDSKKD